MVAFALALIALLDVPAKTAYRPPVRTVDYLELNHRYDDTGRLCYTQVIPWQWMPDYRRHRSLGFALVDETRIESYPTRSADGFYYVRKGVVVWKSRILIETWTEHDPERESRALNGEYK